VDLFGDQHGEDMGISDEVRTLAQEGLTVAQIAKRLGIRYQHAYTVVNAGGARSVPSKDVSETRPFDLSDAVVLVSCVSEKLSQPAEARLLYRSDWFIKARTLVEARGVEWFILSAAYGLVAPSTEIAPYERTLNTAGIAERRAWAVKVHKQLQTVLIGHRHIIMFAGLRYREFLEPALRQDGHTVEVPMEGLRIGEQLAWLGACA